MADVTLADCGGRCWLVQGEAHLDDLLMNSLAPEVEVAVVTCASADEMHELWVSHGGRPEAGEQPWMVHPNILARVRQDVGAGHVVVFAPWSALLDEAAEAVVAQVARRATDEMAAAVVLVEVAAPADDASLAALAGLRATLLRRSLAGHGVAPERIVARPGAAADGARPDAIVILLET